MSKRDDQISLVDMLNHAKEAVDLLGEASLDDLIGDRVMQLALRKLVEVVGEAANRVSEEAQQQHTSIAWGEIIGTRNRMVHGYDDVDLSILWDIIKNDLPPLIEQLETLVWEQAKEEEGTDH